MQIIAIGPKIAREYQSLIEDFAKRLRGAWQTEFILLNYSAKADAAARDEESARILAKLEKSARDNPYVILLDERGRETSSENFAKTLQSLHNQSREIVFIIGGAYGVNAGLRDRADEVLSLSQMVLPHQLARLLLLEQIYRAQVISEHHPYHHQ
jgi:23S rRNA (pseudouridine1915-N3)-methyltransferase